MNMQIRKWIDAMDGNFESEDISPPAQTNETCGCRSHRCHVCFPENFRSTDVKAYESKYTLDDYVKIADVAGGGFGKVIQLFGEMLRVSRTSDGIHLLIHESDLSLVTTDLKESVELQCPKCGSKHGDADFFPRGDVKCGACQTSFYNRFGYDPLEDEPEYAKYEDIEVDFGLDTEGEEEPIEEDPEITQFDEYCNLCVKKYGRVKGRSRFLAMDPQEREQEIERLKNMS